MFGKPIEFITDGAGLVKLAEDLRDLHFCLNNIEGYVPLEVSTSVKPGKVWVRLNKHQTRYLRNKIEHQALQDAYGPDSNR